MEQDSWRMEQDSWRMEQDSWRMEQDSWRMEQDTKVWVHRMKMTEVWEANTGPWTVGLVDSTTVWKEPGNSWGIRWS